MHDSRLADGVLECFRVVSQRRQVLSERVQVPHLETRLRGGGCDARDDLFVTFQVDVS